MSDKNLIFRASKAYHRHCLRNGLIFNRPDTELSEVNGDYIILRSCDCDGVLAVYCITDEGLHFVEHSDSGVREYA